MSLQWDRRTSLVFGFSGLGLCLLFVASMAVGGSSVGWPQLLDWIQSSSTSASSSQFIFSELRLPRSLTCMGVGAALALSGAMLQTLLDNPLSEPYTLGLSGASSLGGVLVFLFSIEPHWLTVPTGAFVVCWAVTFLLLIRARRSVGSDSRSLILSGVMISFLCSSIVSLLMSLMEPSKLQQAIFWMIGQVGSSRDLWWPFSVVSSGLALAWAISQARNFDRFLLGEEVAAGLGTQIISFRTLTVLISAWLTSVSVSQVGIMGFVGLLSPHLAQALLGHRRHLFLFPLTAILGASILTAADVLGRILSQGQEIPAGSLVALVGAPIFIFKLLEQGTGRVVRAE